MTSPTFPTPHRPVILAVGSQNPVKLQCVRSGFEKMFPGQPYELLTANVPSGISAQPLSDAETLQGALNRAANTRAVIPQADLWFGIEGGIEETDGQMSAFAWIVALSAEQTGKGRTGAFFLPPQVAALIRQGKELGEADDLVFGRTNSKQANGAIGLLTSDALDRAQFYEQAVLFALIPFKNPELYAQANGR